MSRYSVYAFIAGSFVAVTLSYYIHRRKNLQKPPKNGKWHYIGTVQEVSVYPITSGAVLLLKEAHCRTDGLYTQDFRDRSLILYGDNGKSAYAGVYPQMLSITTEIVNKNIVIIKAPQSEDLMLNLSEIILKEPIIKQRQGYKLYLVEAEEKHHEWFSKVILSKDQGLKLYYNVRTEVEYNLLGEDKSEFNPVMLMSNESVKDLNQRLPKEDQVHHLQFRGNLLIDCATNIKPYAENNWKWLKIGGDGNDVGNCMLQYHAPCLRCILTNVNIETYKRNPNFEPLKTLKKYRRIHNAKEPTLGAYFKVYQTGTIKLNDPVYAIVN